jgi:hypothetical protein
LNDPVKENEMDGTCSMHVKDEKSIESFNLGIERRRYLEDLRVSEKIILKWFLKNYCGMEWTLVNMVIGFRVQ